MVNLYRAKKRGVAPALVQARSLREAMKATFSEFLSHAIIVMVEEYPQAGTVQSVSQELWTDLVVNAGVMVYKAITSAQWFSSHMGLLVSLNRYRPEFCLYGPEDLVNSEFDTLLSSDYGLEFVGPKDQASVSFSGLVADSAMFEISSDLTLSHTISKQVDGLLECGPSYVKSPSYRQHRKLVQEFKGS